jgi:hypothetical protein
MRELRRLLNGKAWHAAEEPQIIESIDRCAWNDCNARGVASARIAQDYARTLPSRKGEIVRQTQRVIRA